MKIVSPLFTAVLAAAVFAPRADAACVEMCTTTGCSESTNIATGGASKLDIPIPDDAPTCATDQKKYIKSLLVSEQDGLSIDVTFAHAGTTFTPATAGVKGPSDETPTALSTQCSWSYTNVGKSGVTLAGDVIATVRCTDNTEACNVKYKASYGCTPVTACLTPLTTSDGSTPVQLASGTGTTASTAIKTTETTACPWGLKRYISSLKVTEDKGLGVVVSYAQGTSTSATAPTGTTVAIKDNGDGTVDCGVTATDVGLALAKAGTLTDDVVATVKCADNSAACNIKHLATFACPSTDITCPATTDSTLTAVDTVPSTGFVVPAPGTLTCPAGQFKYLKSLDVRGTTVSVAFSNGVTASPVASGSTCAFYKDVKDTKTIAKDVEAKLSCANSATSCAMKYKAEWACTDPIVYTRTGFASDAAGADCVKDLSDCKNRCAKSYQLVTATDAASTPVTTMTFKSQFKTGCTCTDVVATVTDAAAANPAATATDMNVQTTDSDSTLTIAYTKAGSVCKATYKRVAFQNKFADKSYSRTTVTPSTTTTPVTSAADCTPTDLTAPTACPYKCAAEFGLSKPVPDAIRATQTLVDGCTCAPIEVVVGDAGDTAGNGTTVKYDFSKSTNDVTVVTTTNLPAVAASGSTPAVAARTTVCSVLYKESCPKLCTDPACATKDITATGWQLKNLDGCPAYRFSYPKSLIVRAQLAEGAVSVKVGSGAAETPLVDAAFTGTCYKTYGQIGTVASITADVEPTVTCTGGACTVTVKPEWECTPAKCPTDLTGFVAKQSLTVPSAAGVAVAAPAGTCTTGKAYLKSLDIRTTASKDVVVTFNNDLKPEPSSKGDTCTYYSNVIGLTGTATDVTATINCKSTTAGDTCDVQYKADWGCYTPAAPVKYTRTGAPTGRGCVNDLPSCANRCAKSYQLITAGADKMLVPQFTAGCACPSLTATTDGTTATKAKNTVTTMEVNEVAASNTLTVEYTAPGKECKTTFAKTAFENKFAAKTYTRGTVPTECVVAETAAAADLCAYKCAAELTIKPTSDTINATETAVTGLTDCTCKELAGAVVDGDGNVAAGLFGSVKYSFALTSAGLDVTTVVGTKTCKVPYTVKATPAPTTAAPTSGPTSAPTPQPTTTTKTGTSAGVSALGAGADAGMVTVTLMAAAAGVQAVGLPA